MVKLSDADLIAAVKICCGPPDDMDCDGCPARNWCAETHLDIMYELEQRLSDLRTNIETLTRINEDWRCEVARLHKKVDDARAAGMRLNGVAEKPGTNYRKIVKMGPLWLANWIWKLGTVCDCCDLHGCCGIPEEEVTEEYCLEHILMWLAQEAE